MNNKKFMNALLFSAALLSTGMMSSCNDYDDDIDSLNNRVDAVETTLANLQKQIQEGKWVTSFAANSSNTGYILTLSDGSTLEIKNGEKGANGTAGTNGTSWEIDETTKNWIKVDADGTRTDMEICAEGQKGDKGEDGKSPYIEAGRWMIWNAEEEKFVDGGSAVGTASYVVEYEAYWELNVVVADKEGNATDEFHKIILPKTADITSLEVYALNEEGTALSEPNIELNLGKVEGTSPVTFNGKTYQPGEVLVSKNTQLVAQVNPLDADASLYTFSLVNTKGVKAFEVSEATQNKSEEPLQYTRAAEAEEDKSTDNPGLWNLYLSVPAGTIIEDDKAAYSLQTNAITKENTVIASRYDINIIVGTYNGGSPFWKSNVVVEAGESIAWPALWEEILSNPETNKFEVADYYFSIAEGKIAQAQKDGVSLDAEGKTITFAKSTATDAPIDYIEVHYLSMKGNVSEKTLKINVESNSEVAFSEPFVLDLNNKNNNVLTVDIEGNDALNDYLTTAQPTEVEATYKFVSENVTVDGEVVDQEKVDLAAILGKVTFTPELDPKTGYYTWTASLEDINANNDIYAENYTGSVELKNNKGEVLTVNFSVEVKAPAAYDFKAVRNNSYFEGDAASAFSTVGSEVDGYGIVSEYDLFNLFNIPADERQYVEFTEVLPQTTDGEFPMPMLGRQWITTDESNKIIVPAYDEKEGAFDGAYSERTMQINYHPFNNPNLSSNSYEFKLTVRSAIYEGVFEYDAKKAAQTIDVMDEKKKQVVLNVTDITAKDVFGDAYDFTNAKGDDDRIVRYEVKWDDNAQAYLNVGETSTYTDGKITVTRNDNETVVIEDTPCVGTITVYDAWGRSRSTTVTITVKKNDVKE